MQEGRKANRGEVGTGHVKEMGFAENSEILTGALD